MAERTYKMSRKDLDRMEAVQHVVAKRLTQSQAGDDLGISARQVRRLVRRYRTEGRSGLISRRRGKPGNHRLANDRNARVTVCKPATGDIVILYKGAALRYRALKKGERASPVEDEKSLNQRVGTACKAQARRRT